MKRNPDTTDFNARRRWLKSNGLGGIALGAGLFSTARGARSQADAPATPGATFGTDAAQRSGELVTALPDSVGPGLKFAASGQAQVFPGYTLICHVPRPGAAFDALCEARDLLRSEAVFRRKLTWMPEHSYHMTVCDLLNVGHDRRGSSWPAGVPTDASLASAGEHIAKLLRRFELEATPPYRMVVDEEDMHQAIFANGVLRTVVPWRPIDAAEHARMYSLRDKIFAAIGIRHAQQDSYRFHTTLAYPIDRLTAAEADDYRLAFPLAMQRLRRRLPVLEFGAPEFCRFESMYLFEKQFELHAG